MGRLDNLAFESLQERSAACLLPRAEHTVHYWPNVIHRPDVFSRKEVRYVACETAIANFKLQFDTLRADASSTIMLPNVQSGGADRGMSISALSSSVPPQKPGFELRTERAPSLSSYRADRCPLVAVQLAPVEATGVFHAVQGAQSPG